LQIPPHSGWPLGQAQTFAWHVLPPLQWAFRQQKVSGWQMPSQQRGSDALRQSESPQHCVAGMQAPLQNFCPDAQGGGAAGGTAARFFFFLRFGLATSGSAHAAQDSRARRPVVTRRRERGAPRTRVRESNRDPSMDDSRKLRRHDSERVM
jgi:hypothetical protein